MLDFIVKLLFLLVFLGFFYGACATVQITRKRPGMRYVVLGTFGTVGTLVLLLGLLSLAAPMVVNRRSGTFLLALGIATVAPLFRPVRWLFSRFTPLDPTSTIDTAGLVVFFWVLAVAATEIFTLDLATLSKQVQITVGDALLNALAFPLLALSLVGVFVIRDWRESVKRLGLEQLTLRQAAIALGLVVPALAVSVAVDYAGRFLQPALYAQVDSVLRAMSAYVTNPLVAVVIALSAGFGEEIFFRGAIQPRFGIPLTALVFALSHLQYGPSVAIGGVFVLGLVLGWERKSLNTTACILTHAAYNAIALLANAMG